VEIEISEEICIVCGVPFWITKSYQKKLYRCHNTFYCPNGHVQYYPGETDFEKLKKAQREIQNLNWEKEHITKSNSALKGVITKMKKAKK
jgi:hypothetical protein